MIGMTLFACGLGLLVGSPSAGAILANGTRSGWTGMLGFSGVVVVMGFICLCVTRVTKKGWNPL